MILAETNAKLNNPDMINVRYRGRTLEGNDGNDKILER